MSGIHISWDDANRPYSDKFGDHFYSCSDGRAECRHVFLQGNDLPARWQAADRFVIGELGFGTGLNFFETWRQWRAERDGRQHLSFVSFEAHPMRASEITRAISTWPNLAGLLETFLPCWESLTPRPAAWTLDEHTSLTLIQGDAFQGVNSWNGATDAWFLDGFAPAKNPEMWSGDLMQAVFGQTRPGGTFATYTAAGWVRRNLEQAGFAVRRIPGFPRKRHMLTGVKTGP